MKKIIISVIIFLLGMSGMLFGMFIMGDKVSAEVPEYNISLDPAYQEYTYTLCTENDLSYELGLAVLYNTVGFEFARADDIKYCVNKLTKLRDSGEELGLCDEDNFVFILLAYQTDEDFAIETLKGSEYVYTDFINNVCDTKGSLEQTGEIL